MYNNLMMNEKGTEMMNTIYKPKSERRVETSEAIQAFLAAGGSIERVKSRKAPKLTMRGKSSRGYAVGTSGFAVGFPTRSL